MPVDSRARRESPVRPFPQRMASQATMASGSAAVAFFMGRSLTSWLGICEPHTLASLAIATATWQAGWFSGALTSVLCLGWLGYFYIYPGHLVAAASRPELTVAAYGVIDALLIYLMAALRRSMARLEQDTRKKDAFIAVLSHEIRHPLQAIQLATRILQTVHDQAAQGRAVEILARQTNQLGTLLDDLLDMSRISRSRIELHKSVFDLRDCVKDAIDENAGLIADKCHVISVDTPDDPLLVEADRTRLTQVLANLISNAAKYSNNDASIAVRARVDGGGVEVVIGDSGTGIDAAMLPHLFDLAYRPPSGDLGRHGLGLGLWLSRQLIALHGGTIEAASDGVGKGARFVMRLPSSARGQEADKKHDGAASREGAVD